MSKTSAYKLYVNEQFIKPFYRYVPDNFKITDDNLGVGTPSERYENNVAAIKLLKQLESELQLFLI